MTEQQTSSFRPQQRLFPRVLPSEPTIAQEPPEPVTGSTSQPPSTIPTAVITTSVAENISQRSDPELFDPSVPYIWGFSNAEEFSEPVDLRADQPMPEWLRGALYRIGPGLFDLEYLDRRKNEISVLTMERWQDGLAMMHRFEFTDTQTVSYRSRYLAKALEQELRDYAHRHNLSLIRNPNVLLHSRELRRSKKLLTMDPSSANVNQSLAVNFFFGAGFRGELTEEEQEAGGRPRFVVASSDLNVLQEVDPITLIPKRLFSYTTFNSDFKGYGAISCFQYDEKRHESVHITIEPGVTSFRYNIFAVRRDDYFEPPGHLIASINAAPSVVRSFALTERYVILIVYPFSAGFANVHLWNHPLDFESKLTFDRNAFTYFHVIDRDKREQVCIFRTAPCFARHVVNAYEDKTTQAVYIDMNTYDTDLIDQCFHLKNVRTMGMPPLPGATVRRYCLPNIPDSAKLYRTNRSQIPEATFTHRTDCSVENPRLNPRFRQQIYRYAYGTSISADCRKNMNQLWNELVKVDLREKTKLEWREEGCYPGEPVMVPRPDGDEEDDGAVLCVVLEANKNRSFLLVLDAKEMSEISRVYLPAAVPYTTHGDFTFERMY